MAVSIIGSGAIGSVLARRFAAHGIDVTITNSRGASSLGELVRELGPHVRAVDLPEALEADTIILAVLYTTVPEFADKIDWSGRTVIDATNAIDFSDFSPTDLNGRLSSDIVAETLPGARVVKAFNTLRAAILDEDPSEAEGRRVIFVSGDDAEARKSVAALVGRLGYAAVDLGRIQEGGRLQQFGENLQGLNLILKP
ncbi:NADPH-dependent F420 reductase [Rhizobium sp. CCGE 510]|uniref:NADPH-dependent F420 reductase n=1 Tax=Rhizobium sp. CCGE 510 TaxID=1132836 RepID=UPI00027B90E0|nr:NADPH-dependent F420 reductase [Rhizobium sp. CCGE 510]EJT05353.1 NADP oxidoreductase coenzyme F420-dependent [Rhizobium sp. CCGE 510]